MGVPFTDRTYGHDTLRIIDFSKPLEPLFEKKKRPKDKPVEGGLDLDFIRAFERVYKGLLVQLDLMWLDKEQDVPEGLPVLITKIKEFNKLA